MSHLLSIKKGLDLRLAGGLDSDPSIATVVASTVAVAPPDFTGLVPKVDVAEGDAVKAGQPLVHDKTDEAIKLVAPVSGTVKAVVRGERRRVLRIEIEADGKGETVKFDTLKINHGREASRELLKNSGLWAMMRQLPYAIVPEGDKTPRDIFVTAFDSAPLAADMAATVADKEKELAAGVKFLASLTDGKVYVSRRQGALADIPGAEMVDVKGPHPAGNVGVQIANLAPVNKGETVWELDVVTLWRIGALALTGVVAADTVVAVTGSEVKEPKLVKTAVGASIDSLLKNNVKTDGRDQRVISGNVLTGTIESRAGFLRYPYRQVTVIPEGDDVDEFMGWASISPKKMSQSRSFPGHFLFGKKFAPDARLLGGRRALIMSGEYDKYLPMDIMAEYLLKAIISRDIEKMEELGIYEIAPEDLALGEYADTSKIEAQKIVREGLDYLRKELE